MQEVTVKKEDLGDGYLANRFSFEVPASRRSDQDYFNDGRYRGVSHMPLFLQQPGVCEPQKVEYINFQAKGAPIGPQFSKEIVEKWLNHIYPSGPIFIGARAHLAFLDAHQNPFDIFYHNTPGGKYRLRSFNLHVYGTQVPCSYVLWKGEAISMLTRLTHKTVETLESLPYEENTGGYSSESFIGLLVEP